ncbi:SurA N-terminal domain-containing protein [Bowmanella sp. JS7-9]|uniref:Periplasmic chaperone PpiD n=1 Tax=Pseudobowmanella zhangzhouensis TaxID=1537679 RepID=A0ABW1XHA3_9ALTE|nr:SurA N-terminal domain-containing protein [Bowmanella sp. JS7-9]TBX25817.1 hypothetical protein TK45_03825 [Bowmanella sp. JS7-9]
MLEKIREESQGFWAKVILGLVIITFALAGVGSYLNTRGDEPIAEVNGEEISVAAFEAAYQQARNRMEQQYGQQFSVLAADANYLKTFRQQILEQMISERLLDQATAEMELRVSEERVNREIVAIPDFQVEGKFDNQRYNDLLRLNGRQPAEFKATLRAQLTRQQLISAVTGSEFALGYEVNQLLALQQQQRDVRVATVNAEQFVGSIEVTDADIEDYYQANLASYDTEEKVAVQYIELALDDLMAGIEISDADVETYYSANQNRYMTDAKRNVTHILIEFGDDEAAAQAKAEALLADLQAGADFAQLAKDNSADSFSAEKGGELGMFGKGEMDPAFEEAAFALNTQGELSAVVKSSFGFHILKLVEAQDEQVSPLSEVKDQIVAALKRERALSEMYELHEQVSQLAFEQPEHLDEVAALLKKSLQQTELFSHDDAPAPFDNALVQKAAFDADLIQDRVNSEVIEIEPNHYVVFRVSDYQPIRTLTLDEVSADIRSLLTEQKAQLAAKAWAEEQLAKLTAGEDISAALTEKGSEWQAHDAVGRFANGLAPAVSSAAFKLGTTAENNSDVVELSDGNVAMVQVLAVKAGEAPAEDLINNMQGQLLSANARQIVNDFVQALRAKAEVKQYAGI